MNKNVNDFTNNIKVIFLCIYAFRHNISFGAYRSLSKRSVSGKMCNLLERLTLDKEYKLPGMDWKKEVGNSMFGANFGVKISNRMHLHICMFSTFPASVINCTI